MAWVRIGKVVRPLGLQGFLGVAGREDGTEGLRRVRLRRPGGEPEELAVLEDRPQGRLWAVRVAGVADRTAAEG